MEITLEIDDAKCAKCGATGEMVPEVIVRHKESFRVQRAVLPENWSRNGLDGALLCDKCIALWKEFVAPLPAMKMADLGKMIPVPQKTLVESIPLKAAPAQPPPQNIRPAPSRTGAVIERATVDNNGNPLVRHNTVTIAPAKDVQRTPEVIRSGPPVAPTAATPVPTPIQRPPLPMTPVAGTVQQGRVFGATPHSSKKTIVEKTIPMKSHNTVEVTVEKLPVDQTTSEVTGIEPIGQMLTELGD